MSIVTKLNAQVDFDTKILLVHIHVAIFFNSYLLKLQCASQSSESEMTTPLYRMTLH